MKTIRRLYFYLVAFISMEIVLWGLIGLARLPFSSSVGGSANDLAQALARIVVGVPVFGIHWWAAQRSAHANDEEHASGVRAFFLYAALFALFVPIVQSVWAVLNRLMLDLANIPLTRAIVGGSQNLADNLIAILMNGIIGAYFLQTLRKDWEAVSEKDSLRLTRRIYRYLWVLYALGLSIAGVQQVLRYLFSSLAAGTSSSEAWFINGLALLIVGAPLWYWTWKNAQDALDEPGEQRSLLRLGVLYFLTLASVITVLTSVGNILYEILEALFNSDSFQEMFGGIRGPLSVAIPFGAVWAYYGGWLQRDLDTVPDAPRRAGMKRLYAYILAAIGLAASFSGVVMLFSYFIDLLRDTEYLSTDLLSGAIAVLVVGLPLWLRTWRPMQTEALADTEAGEHARRSLIRRIYLYVAIFAGVVGGMIAAVRLISLLLEALLNNPGRYFAASSLDALQMLVLFGILLAYHWQKLQADGKRKSAKLDEKRAAFNVLYLTNADDPLALQLASVMKKECPEINLLVQPTPETDTDVHALILPEDGLLTNDAKLTAWIAQFSGSKFIVQREANEWFWVEKPAQIARSLQALAEGEDVQLKQKTPGWMIAVYILAGLMVFQILLLLTIFVVDSF